MISLTCEWLDEQVELGRSGFDLGHMTFSGEKGICTSKGRSPDQAMMIAVSVKELLYGLEVFVGEGRYEYVFGAVDSSYSVVFKRNKKRRISVLCGRGGDVDDVDEVSLCRSVLAGVEDFVESAMDEISWDDPVRDDLLSSVQRFRSLMAGG
jgi:hypothetical protein